jgi:diguanylate cyclase (GGDEF)-like protein/PAS domain S-box-containing protein
MGAPETLARLMPPTVSAQALQCGWAVLLDSLPDAAWIVEGAGLSVVAANGKALALLGRTAANMIGQPVQALAFTPEDLAYWDEAASGVPGPMGSESRIGMPDGQTLHVMRSVRPFQHDGGQVHYMVVLTDLSERYRAEERLEQALSELQATLESTADGILVTDLGGRIRAFNRRFADIWGLPANLLEARDDQAVHDWLRRSVQDSDAYELRLRALVNATLASGNDTLTLHSRQVIERVTQPLWHRGRPMGRVYAFRDLSDRLAADRRILELSQTDALTGLPNRGELSAMVERASAALVTANGGSFALLLVDLDRFSNINDTLGSSRADLVLLEVSERLRACTRQGDLVARLAGDQFALLVHHADPAAAEVAARRVLDAVSVPSSVDGMQFTLTCSIGVVISPLHGRGLDELMSHAEQALRRAKNAGRGGWRVHTMRRETDLRTSLRMDHAMRQALANQRFRLHFQPQVDMSSGHVVGAEALLRWRDPEFGGDVSPARFIPVAEESGLIVALGQWVLTEAVRQAARWHAKGLPVPVAVNVSALQFEQPDFVERVASALSNNRLPAHWLELEVTESILVHDAEDMLTRLKALERLGVRLSIDDFGTGYSSLAYLKRFPIGQVKIDRSFVAGLPGDDSDAGIVRAILQMAQALGMGAIAEGVENEGQHRFLREAGCSRFQGFFFAPAVDAARFEERWLRPGGVVTRGEERPN